MILLTIRQAARLLGKSRESINARIRRKTLGVAELLGIRVVDVDHLPLTPEQKERLQAALFAAHAEAERLDEEKRREMRR